jgi:preprotein translocase subunit SecB
MLAPINFDALYMQQKQAAEANANGEAPAPELAN